MKLIFWNMNKIDIQIRPYSYDINVQEIFISFFCTSFVQKFNVKNSINNKFTMKEKSSGKSYFQKISFELFDNGITDNGIATTRKFKL